MESSVTTPATDIVAAATLVVPLDGSLEAAAALPIARTLADAESATIHVVYVSDEPLSPSGLVDRLGVAPEELVGAVLTRRVGAPADEIVRQATELGSRLIVMSSHAAQDALPGAPASALPGAPASALPGAPATALPGASASRPARRGSLGEATREVLRQAPCPVVLVPPGRPSSPWPLRQILLPHDGIPTTATAIARATDLARRSRAELAVLHIASPHLAPNAGSGALATPRYLDQPQHEWPSWAGEFMDRFTALGGAPQEVRMRLFLATGEPADAIVDFVNDHHTDLVVIAWVSGWEPEQRPTMRKVIDQAPVPLLIFPLEDAKNGLMF